MLVCDLAVSEQSKQLKYMNMCGICVYSYSLPIPSNLRLSRFGVEHWNLHILEGLYMIMLLHKKFENHWFYRDKLKLGNVSSWCQSPNLFTVIFLSLWTTADSKYSNSFWVLNGKQWFSVFERCSFSRKAKILHLPLILFEIKSI